MKIAVVGTGYVGLVTGVCFAEKGHHVICVDTDADKVARLRAGECPIYEVGLPEMLPRNIETGRLTFTTDLAEAAEHSDVFFIAVGTYARPDGSADLSQVMAVARQLGETIQRPAIIVDKSTVPVGTGEEVEATVAEALRARGADIDFTVVSNPEFLKEGAAVPDFMDPDRVIIGTADEPARATMGELYAPFCKREGQILYMGRRDAEMAKYAANAMLATKISFINEIATLCERLDVDVENVRVGIGTDPRIGFKFINPGCGYGGSCFPKDVQALIHTAQSAGFDPQVLNAVEARNAEQKRRVGEHVRERFGEDLSGLRFGLWGLAFKPGTDDMREAPAQVIAEDLIQRGATVQAHDPEAMATVRREWPAEWLDSGKLTLVDRKSAAAENVDALILVTEWPQFREPDWQALKKDMKQPVIFDGRNQYDPVKLRELGFEYRGIGRRN